MEKSTFVFLHETYADWEVGYILPELARNQKPATFFGLSNQSVLSLGGLTVTPNLSLSDISPSLVKALILPGGLFWKSFENKQFDEFVTSVRKNGGIIAGICAATGYMAKLGLLNNIPHTSNSIPFLKERAPSYSGENFYKTTLAVSNQKLITAGGLGAVDFTYHLLKELGVYEAERCETWYRAFKFGEDPYADPNPNKNANDAKFIRYTIELQKVPNKVTSRETIQRHVEHLRKLDQQGQLVHCGPFTDHMTGMVVVKAKNKEEAIAIANADPFVKEGVRTPQVKTWQLACAENGYLG